MRIKCLILIAAIIFGADSYSQDIVSVIKDFYKNADLSCYIDKSQKRLMEEYHLLGIWDSLYRLHVPPPDVDLHQGNTIPVLNIQFVNTENYNYSDNIYDYITIDSVWMFTFIRVDKDMNVDAFVNLAASYKTCCIGSRESTKLLKSINRHQPDLILNCAMLEKGFGKWYDDGYMYINGNKIYKYVTYNRKSYELNEYFRNYLSLDFIHHYLSFSYIPMIYYKGESERRTGKAPENEKMICSPLNSTIIGIYSAQLSDHL